MDVLRLGLERKTQGVALEAARASSEKGVLTRPLLVVLRDPPPVPLTAGRCAGSGGRDGKRGVDTPRRSWLSSASTERIGDWISATRDADVLGVTAQKMRHCVGSICGVCS